MTTTPARPPRIVATCRRDPSRSEAPMATTTSATHDPATQFGSGVSNHPNRPTADPIGKYATLRNGPKAPRSSMEPRRSALSYDSSHHTMRVVAAATAATMATNDSLDCHTSRHNRLAPAFAMRISKRSPRTTTPRWRLSTSADPAIAKVQWVEAHAAESGRWMAETTTAATQHAAVISTPLVETMAVAKTAVGVRAQTTPSIARRPRCFATCPNASTTNGHDRAAVTSRPTMNACDGDCANCAAQPMGGYRNAG